MCCQSSFFAQLSPILPWPRSSLARSLSVHAALLPPSMLSLRAPEKATAALRRGGGLRRSRGAVLLRIQGTNAKTCNFNTVQTTYNVATCLK